MPIPDKIAAANKINDFLRGVVTQGGLHLKYRITVDPPLPDERDWERPEILVEFAGPDSTLLLERGGELLRAVELLAIEMLRLPGNEHEKICFDCMNQRKLRLEELRMAAGVAADRVRRTRRVYRFGARDRRLRRRPCEAPRAATCAGSCSRNRFSRARSREGEASRWPATQPRVTVRRRAREAGWNQGRQIPPESPGAPSPAHREAAGRR